MIQHDLSDLTIVFDLDGTLVDTAPDLLNALNLTLGEMNLPPVHRENIGYLFGKGGRAMLERALALNNIQPTETEIETYVNIFLGHYRCSIANDSAHFPGVRATLEILKKSGVNLAVCTNKNTELSVLLLEKLTLNHFFSAICGRDYFPFHKPDGRHIISTIQESGGNIKNSLMVGDSDTDINSAKNANIPVIAVDFGYSEKPVATFNPTMIISHYDEFVNACQELISD